MQKDLDQEFERLEAENNKSNLDASILRFRAFEKVKACLNRNNITATTQKIDQEDVVAGFARAWFT